MKEFSKETIEINGKEYTLFLNRKGIIAWEKFCKEENEKVRNLKEKYKNVFTENKVEITEETNPFEGIEEIDDFDDDTELIKTIYKRLYWIMLYTEHKLSIKEASELYDLATKEYQETDLILLAQQMVEDANKDKVTNKNLKNLTALRPKK